MTPNDIRYDHYYLNCGELTSLDNPRPPPQYYSLPDEEDYALFEKVKPKQSGHARRKSMVFTHEHSNFYVIIYDDVYADEKCCLVGYVMCFVPYLSAFSIMIVIFLMKLVYCNVFHCHLRLLDISTRY